MAERLTEYFECGAYTEKQNIIDVSDKVKFFDNGCVMGKAIDKLAQLEDIMEKYGIESVEELDKKLADSITWQKSCELACKELEKRNCFAQDKQTRRIVDLKDCFYQQAKMEGDDESNIHRNRARFD